MIELIDIVFDVIDDIDIDIHIDIEKDIDTYYLYALLIISSVG